MRNFFYTLSLLTLSTAIFAQDQAVAADPVTTVKDTPGFLGTGDVALDFLCVAVALLVLILLLVSVVLLNTFKKLSKELANPTPVDNEPQRMLEFYEWEALQKSKPGIWSKLLGLKPLEEEKDLLLDHEFDGISELDNPTPAWFMWLFYATIAIGAGYLFTYHFSGWGKLQEEEYVIEMDEAKAAKDALLKGSANNIDENTVKETVDKAALSSGAVVYNANCVACHGDKGQGVVGPNLTDEYWLHGGTINSVFKTIKYGVPDKGMVSWGKSLSPKQISDVSNYIKSLKGSNPANPKAPQGEKEG
ncbi:cbb3-type cytochrome c oxidase N-terminal domain-containing protein [Desertivirga brevis]|uniref:cbb3-type cytochrome c oxidase N-terminal domain-containing protein n=1 Tax=Desertivirga brevis TaxID=2810310 RepID=UPI001A96D528|nr:cbb3-type cytochrome c oxidase N-terminal domain-containing protein [Pedobacter sp. SYSU D00873]